MNHGSPHLTDDELIGMLYGLGDQEHLAGCSECNERWDAMYRALGMVRAESVRGNEISGRKLAVQRAQILERVEQPRSHAWRWAPVAAAASLVAVAMFLHQQGSVPQPASPAAAVANSEADTALFTDVYSMERDVEPKAAAPIRALFQETALQETALEGERR